jgi:hypothetical protein
MARSAKQSRKQPPTRVAEAAHRILLDELRPFLRTLHEAELEKMTGQRPRGGARPSNFRGPRLPNPVEVLFARLDGRIVGALLLNGKWIEQVLRGHGSGSLRQRKTLEESNIRWLDWLTNDISHTLAKQAEFLPFALAAGLLNDWDNPSDWDERSVEYVLNLLESSTSAEIGKWLTLRLVSRLAEDVASDDSSSQRDRARAILRRWTEAKRGRRELSPERTADASLFREVVEAVKRLREGWSYVHHSRKDGHHANRLVLGLKYDDNEIDVLIGGRHRRILGAAISLVAQRHGKPAENISTRISRHRKRQRRNS